MPFDPFFGEGSPAKIDYKKVGTLFLASLLEDLVDFGWFLTVPCFLFVSLGFPRAS